MSLGRRKVSVLDPTRWVFNRMADVYDARPPYPADLVAALAALGPRPMRIGDLGAGLGHLAVPLAALGHDVTAVEPAIAMLERLRDAAHALGLRVHTVHASAEALPLPDASLDLVLVADALHFIDAELLAREVSRVLAPGGALALVTCALADTPFMRGVVEVMEQSAPRRPRALRAAVTHLAAGAGIVLGEPQHFADATPVDGETLERILRSVSYIGPAMHAARFAAFRDRIFGLPGQRVWARTFTLRWGRRRGPSNRARARARRRAV